MRRSHVLGVLVLAALCVVVVIAMPAGAQAPSVLSFKELNKGSTFKLVDVPPRQKNQRTPPSVGDQLIFTNPLQKSATTTAGKLHVRCTVTKSGRKFSAVTALCDGAYAFANGTIYASALIKLAAENPVGAVTGGTGAYAGARGTFESKNVKGGSQTTITLIP